VYWVIGHFAWASGLLIIVKAIPHSIQCVIASYGTITGLVRNDNSVPVAGISLYAWSLRDDGSRGFTETQIAAPLSPGEEKAFHTGSLIPICGYDGPYPGVSIHSLQYAAQGTVLP
jgi:hypothetical protein